MLGLVSLFQNFVSGFYLFVVLILDLVLVCPSLRLYPCLKPLISHYIYISQLTRLKRPKDRLDANMLYNALQYNKTQINKEKNT